jgi:phosphatidylserine/phosphatidylglycerophosphate/cardiolipin synthase-like enzyme
LIGAAPSGLAADHSPSLQAFTALPTKTGVQATKVRLITDNSEGWYARWYMIQQARRTLDVTYFIVEDDIFGKSLLGLLLKKSLEGVQIRLLVDARGSTLLTKRLFSQAFLQALAARPNVVVKVFNPYSKGLLKVASNIRNLIASNHDKIILVDGDWAITGGRNVAAAYFADPRDRSGCFRDTDILMRGGTVADQMKEAFEEEFEALQNYQVSEGWFPNWKNKRQELDLARRVMQRWISGRGTWNPRDLSPDAAKVVARLNKEIRPYSHLTSFAAFLHDPWNGRREVPVKILDKHSFRGQKNNLTSHMIELLDSAREQVVIQNPYVVLTSQVMAALKRADARGVRITIHTNSPATDDALVTQSFFLRDWWKMLRDLPHLRIFAYQKKGTMLHAKTFLIDDTITSVGTYNLDPMSQGINGEIMAIIQSPEFAIRSRRRIENDITTDSVEYRIKRDSHGKVVLDSKGHVVVLSGPSQGLRGARGALIKLLSHLKFLRPLI